MLLKGARSSAASTSQVNSRRDCEPVVFMIDVRWCSIVRWLIPIRIADFLHHRAPVHRRQGVAAAIGARKCRAIATQVVFEPWIAIRCRAIP